MKKIFATLLASISLAMSLNAFAFAEGVNVNHSTISETQALSFGFQTVDFLSSDSPLVEGLTYQNEDLNIPACVDLRAGDIQVQDVDWVGAREVID